MAAITTKKELESRIAYWDEIEGSLMKIFKDANLQNDRGHLVDKLNYNKKLLSESKGLKGDAAQVRRTLKRETDKLMKVVYPNPFERLGASFGRSVAKAGWAFGAKVAEATKPVWEPIKEKYEQLKAITAQKSNEARERFKEKLKGRLGLNKQKAEQPKAQHGMAPSTQPEMNATKITPEFRNKTLRDPSAEKLAHRLPDQLTQKRNHKPRL
jgi:hypothetical protein